MLKEFTQAATKGDRRWFSDDYFDLIVWYDANTITGFQLCYDLPGNERALTWRMIGGYGHDRVDEGETPFRAKRTPILLRDGTFDKDGVAKEFDRRSRKIDQAIARLVYTKITEYP
jgi:hypothetical protein